MALFFCPTSSSITRSTLVPSTRSLFTRMAFIAGAHIMRETTGLSPDPHERPVVAVLDVSDQSSYLSVLASVMRAGADPLPISTRNSDTATAHLLKSTGCAHIIVSTDAAMQTLASGAAAQMAGALSMHPMPTF
ncbi:hypothetical protein GGX14DRAFT_581501 [Mycena pura]|uniref:Uncharacterized protein n=1 Tax=Mycena pura TaxID=153505 RepID=A0AAD6YU34_9AGAR|nr:hypothetical protein GGX14DRAFT_581501 [Mycena pura]